jgi:lysophospholipase L1-like esterase
MTMACDASSDPAGAVADASTDTADVVADGSVDTTPDGDDVFDTSTNPSDAAEDVADSEVQDQACLSSPVVGGQVYRDLDRSSASHWDQRGAVSNDAPVVGIELSLISRGGNDLRQQTALSCATGHFGWDVVAAGNHIIQLHLPSHEDTTTRNVPRRFPEAAREGDIVMVTFGDSLSHFGPEPWFPARLAALIQPVAAVDNRNVAVPGSTSAQWLPGTPYFQMLEDELQDADVVLFSVGGNDLQQLADLFRQPPFDVAEIVAQGTALIEKVRGQLLTIAHAIRTRAPGADLVWLLYPNYTHSDQWKAILGEYAGVGELLLSDILESMRADFAAIDGVLIADMASAIPPDVISDLLWDEVHLNSAGHALYSRRLFELLGGVRIGEDAGDALGAERGYGLAP